MVGCHPDRSKDLPEDEDDGALKPLPERFVMELNGPPDAGACVKRSVARRMSALDTYASEARH